MLMDYFSRYEVVETMMSVQLFFQKELKPDDDLTILQDENYMNAYGEKQS